MAETSSLLNCRTGHSVPGVRIPPPPQTKTASQLVLRCFFSRLALLARVRVAGPSTFVAGVQAPPTPCDANPPHSPSDVAGVGLSCTPATKPGPSFAPDCPSGCNCCPPELSPPRHARHARPDRASSVISSEQSESRNLINAVFAHGEYLKGLQSTCSKLKFISRVSIFSRINGSSSSTC